MMVNNFTAIVAWCRLSSPLSAKMVIAVTVVSDVRVKVARAASCLSDESPKRMTLLTLWMYVASRTCENRNSKQRINRVSGLRVLQCLQCQDLLPQGKVPCTG